MLAEKNRLEKEITSVSEIFKQLPEGKLVYSSNGKYRKWYQSDGHNKKYIPKSNKQLAIQLAEKKYLLSLLEDMNGEKKAIEFYLRHHKSDVGKVEQLLVGLPEYQELLAPYFIPKSEELNNWMHASYEKSIRNQENLIHKGGSGEYVRSKSEAIIDTFLYMNKIPFRYECALHLKEVTLFPDFTICHPKTGEMYYWEHFGMMDDPKYAKAAGSKIELYIANKLIPSIQLITTFETQDHPLSVETVRKIIEHYFL